MNKIQRHLAKPYPFFYSDKHLLLASVVLIIFSTLFNYFLEPFEVTRSEHRMPFFWICVIHAVFPTLIVIVYYLVLKRKMDTSQWTIGKEMLHWAVILFLIGIQNFLIRDVIYDNPLNWSWRYLYEEVRNAFLVGSLFIFILVNLNLERLIKKYENRAAKVQLHPHASPTAQCYVVTEQTSDDFSLSIDDFLFAKSEGNYVEIYVKSAVEVSKLIKRLPIKKLEEQLATYDGIMRTHRSYLVNVNAVKNVRGNAQGYKLTLHDTDQEVPVSRAMVSVFDQVAAGH